MKTKRNRSSVLLSVSLSMMMLQVADAALASFDIGPIGSSAQSGFTLFSFLSSVGPIGSSPVGGITLSIAGGVDILSAISADLAGNFNAMGLLTTQLQSGVVNSGTFTYADLYEDCVVADVLAFQFNGLQANTEYSFTFYAYDENFARTETFTNYSSPGGTAGNSGMISFAANYDFTDAPNDIFSVTVNAVSDNSGRAFFVETGTGATNLALVSGVGIAPAPEPFVAGCLFLGFGVIVLIHRKRY